jgi:hypothetical protein
MYPEDWIAFLDLPRGVTHIEEADVSTITAAGDKIVQVDAPLETYGVHFEFQAGPDETFVPRLWKYNVLYTTKLGFLVRSVAVLLRPFDGHKTITGRYVRESVEGEEVHRFCYRVMRVWQMPPEAFLEGGLALLPLAAVAKVNKRDVADVVRQIEERLDQHTKPVEGELLRTATSVLLGLKYDKSFVEKIMGKNVLELSSVYQAARQEGLDEGREEGELAGVRETLIRAGRRRLGEPNATTLAFLESITKVETLESFVDQLWDIESWEELQKS